MEPIQVQGQHANHARVVPPWEFDPRTIHSIYIESVKINF